MPSLLAKNQGICQDLLTDPFQYPFITWLKSLESVMAVPNYLATHMEIIMPLYGLLLTVMIVLQLRETKRLNGCRKDWLIDG